MNLRSGRIGIRKSARIKDEEDDQENFEAEDRVDRIPEDEADFESVIREGNFNLDQKKREVDSIRMSTLSRDVPTDRQPMFDFPKGYKDGVTVCICLIIGILIFQKPLYFGCNEVCPTSAWSDSLDKLYQEYPRLETFWKDINVTYKMCTRSDRPGVILVLHNGNGDVANCIVNKTASLLSRLLGVHPAGEFLSVDGRTALSEYGNNDFLRSIMEQRQKFGVVVFSYLEHIDSGLVKDLHFICDKDLNIADKAIIILVLKVKKQTFENENLEDMAKRQIRDLWGETLGGRVQPIIGRITNIVGSIDENVITHCS